MSILENNKVKVTTKGDISYLQFYKLLAYEDKIVHAYTLKSNYKDYTVDNGSNYKELCEALEIQPENLVRIKEQIHSALVKPVENTKQVFTKIDGLITNKQGISFSLRFADCTPLFFYDPIHNAIGDIHSGWKGTVQKIAREAVIKMQETYGTNPKELICCIGPRIGKCHFEVHEDVKTIFEQAFSNSKYLDKAIEKGRIEEGKQKYHIDTTLLNIELLLQLGLQEENIIDCGICTACHSDLFHSYRVDRQNAGRNTAIIGMRAEK